MTKDLQRIDLKVFVDAPENPNFDPILTAFARWRHEADAPSDWVDLADYAHMHRGPKIMMAGKRENFALDTNIPGPGILVQTRKDLSGSIEQRFLEAFRRHLTLATRLINEPEWPSEFSARGGDWLIAVNDRLQFPNDEPTDSELRQGLTAALDKLFNAAGYSLTRDEDPQRRYGLRVTSEGNPTLKELLANAG